MSMSNHREVIIFGGAYTITVNGMWKISKMYRIICAYNKGLENIAVTTTIRYLVPGHCHFLKHENWLRFSFWVSVSPLDMCHVMGKTFSTWSQPFFDIQVILFCEFWVDWTNYCQVTGHIHIWTVAGNVHDHHTSHPVSTWLKWYSKSGKAQQDGGH